MKDNKEGQVSPRFVDFSKRISEWLDQYGEFTDDDGIDLIVLGHDEKYNGRLVYTLVNEEKPLHSIFRAYNHGLGQIGDEIEKEVFNGVADWYAQMFAKYPKLYNKFKDTVEYYKKKEDDS